MNFFDKLSRGIIGAGTWIQELQENLRPKMGALNKQELGVSGTERAGNQLDEEYLEALADNTTRCEEFDKMIKSEPGVRLSFSCWEMPIVGANWDILAPDMDAKGKVVPQKLGEERSDFCKANLFENPKKSWQEQMREILSYLPYGYAVFERVWEVKNSQAWIEGLYWRSPKTIEWDWDEEDNLSGIKQKSYFGGRKTPKPIPVKDLVIFSNDRLGKNYEGIGLCRYQWRPYFMKRRLMNYGMIGFERFLVTSPTLQPGQDARVGSETEAQNYIANIRSGSKAGGVIPFGWTDITKEMSLNGMAVAMRMLDFLNQEMFYAALTQFVALGTKGTGSYALSKDQTDFFNMALKSVVDYICGIFNYYIIPDLLDINFGDGIYPTLEAKIIQDDATENLKMINEVVKNGIIPVYPEMQEQVITALGLPEKDMLEYQEQKKKEVEELLKNQKPPEVAPGAPGQNPPLPPGQPPQNPPENPPPGNPPAKKSEAICHSEHKPFWRELNEREKAIGGAEYLEEKNKIFTQKREAFQKSISPILEKQKRAILKVAKEKGVAGVTEMEIPGQDEFRKLAEKYITEATIEGLRQKEQESKKTLPEKVKIKSREKLIQWSKQRAEAITKKQAEDLRNFIANKLTNKLPIPEEKKLSEAILDLAVKRYLEAFNVEII